mmetsp:Transcript_19698/g.31902  ORF Transcript_19698/g.31902 Transcript_19698/m.31902 type:complete len:253 (-) Transcript_19698:66-824(-)
MENLKEAVVMERVKDAVAFAEKSIPGISGIPGPAEAQAAIDGGITTAVHQLNLMTSVRLEAARGHIARGEAHARVIVARLQAVDNEFFRQPTALIASAIAEQPYTTLVATGIGAALLLPGTRRALWRATFGRQSEEAIFNSCQRSAETLKIGAEGRSAELTALKESAAAAAEEMARGKSKLHAAAAALKRLGSVTAREESKVAGVMDELRLLPSKQAMGLLSEMAGTAASLSKVRGGVDSTLTVIHRNGVNI